MSSEPTIEVDLTFNDLLAIAKLLNMYMNPSQVFFLAPSYFEGMSQAVEHLNTKLATPEINRFMITKGVTHHA